ncbi:helix-turn-helix domain-containing protein [Butyrivibrio sp. JL13D10]|uniref:helix-turn-helix domain-containing protein n=1 Tax=Butyrivibrio sp. JL13D10 TaxID=3236815 RepID=UPI0038B515C3
MQESLKTIGERIKYLREKHGISQSSIAREFHLAGGSSVVCKYELEKRDLPLDVVVAYSKKFGVTTDWILKGA